MSQSIAIIVVSSGTVAYINGASINNVDPATATGKIEDWEWKYDTQTVPSSHLPSAWDMVSMNAVCNTGTSQSPINIVAADAKTATGTDIGAVMTTLFDTDITGYLANTGRVLRWMSLGTARPTIMGGPLGTKM